MDRYDNYNSPEPSSSKRNSLAAQLDQGATPCTFNPTGGSLLSNSLDPALSSSRRALKSDLFSSRMASKSLERRLLAAETAKQDLEFALKEKEIAIERLGNERRWLAEREAEEREERKRLTSEWVIERVRALCWNAKRAETDAASEART